MRTYIFFLSIGLLLLQLPGLAQQKDEDESLIRQTLTNYIEGRNGGELERLKKAFHPAAALKFVEPGSGQLVAWSLQDYLSKLQPAKKQNCRGEILDIRIFNDAAQATVALSYPDLLFHDYMSLLKIEGSWLIVDKIFARKSKQNSQPMMIGGYGSPAGKAFDRYGHNPQDASCEICAKQEYRDKSAHCPHIF